MDECRSRHNVDKMISRRAARLGWSVGCYNATWSTSPDYADMLLGDLAARGYRINIAMPHHKTGKLVGVLSRRNDPTKGAERCNTRWRVELPDNKHWGLSDLIARLWLKVTEWDVKPDDTPT